MNMISTMLTAMKTSIAVIIVMNIKIGIAMKTATKTTKKKKRKMTAIVRTAESKTRHENRSQVYIIVARGTWNGSERSNEYL